MRVHLFLRVYFIQRILTIFARLVFCLFFFFMGHGNLFQSHILTRKEEKIEHS